MSLEQVSIDKYPNRVPKQSDRKDRAAKNNSIKSNAD
jgi:hypothetical protein